MRESEKLVRAVGFWGLVAMCINGVVGSGVFLLPSESFSLLGPFSLWAPALFAIPVLIFALCFAEASSYFTAPGGAYLYSRTAFGDFIGFETGWMNTLARITSLASLSNGVVLAAAHLFPSVSAPAPRAAIIVSTLVGFALLHASGIRYGARTIYAFTLGKMVPLVVFIVLALIAFRHNPIPASLTFPVAGTDWSKAAMFMLFAYAGFENLPIPAGEFKNPKRDLPLALLTGIGAVAVVYVLAQFAAMTVITDLAATKTPIADAAAMLMGPTGGMLVTIGALISIMGTNLGTMLEASRMVFAISEDRPRYRWLSHVHSLYRTPIRSIFLLAAIAIPVALSGSFAQLAVLSAMARLTTYLFTCAAIPRLRKMGGGGFRAPGGLVLPVLGVLFSVALFAARPRFELLAAAIALAVGALLWSIGRAEPLPPAETTS
jgi:basic amino acid/polyamine antiporter, APA family